MAYFSRRSSYGVCFLASLTMVPHLLPILWQCSVVATSFLRSVSGLVFIVSLYDEELILVCDYGGSCCHLNGCCLYVFPVFETDFLPNFEFQCGEKVNCCVGWASNMCFFENKMQNIITFIPERQWNCYRLKKTCKLFDVGRKVLAFCLPQNVYNSKNFH